MVRPSSAVAELQWHETFARWLRDARSRRHLSQEALAFAAGIDVATYRRVEREPRQGEPLASARFETVIKILIALDLVPHELQVCIDMLVATASRVETV